LFYLNASIVFSDEEHPPRDKSSATANATAKISQLFTHSKHHPLMEFLSLIFSLPQVGNGSINYTVSFRFGVQNRKAPARVLSGSFSL
jgi:hypothetical protein